MKTKILFYIIIISIKGIFAQTYQYIPIPDSGAIWSEVYYFGEPYPDTVLKPPSYERFTVNGEDTIINGKTYNKLYMFYNNEFNLNNSIYIGGIREENKKVYLFCDSAIHEGKSFYSSYSNEHIIYDFNLNVGDTFYYENKNIEQAYKIVTNIDSILIDNTYRKRFYFYNLPFWVEGIGNIFEGFLYNGPTPIGAYHNEFICFIKNDSVLYHNNNNNNCLPTSIKHLFDKQMCAYPNPSVNYINFKIEYNYNDITIYNINGKKVCKINVKNKNIVTIKNLTSGIYIYQLSSDNKLTTGKFIITKN